MMMKIMLLTNGLKTLHLSISISIQWMKNGKFSILKCTVLQISLNNNMVMCAMYYSTWDTE